MKRIVGILAAVILLFNPVAHGATKAERIAELSARVERVGSETVVSGSGTTETSYDVQVFVLNEKGLMEEQIQGLIVFDEGRVGERAEFRSRNRANQPAANSFPDDLKAFVRGRIGQNGVVAIGIDEIRDEDRFAVGRVMTSVAGTSTETVHLFFVRLASIVMEPCITCTIPGR